MVDRQAEQLHWVSRFALNDTNLNGRRVDDHFRESLAQLDGEELPALISLTEPHHILIRTFDPVANSAAAQTVVPQFHPLLLEAEHPASTPLFGFCP